MYSIGENFFYELDGEEVEFSILGDMIIKGKEYLVTEDEDHNRFVFLYDDEDEVVVLLEDEEQADKLIETWETDFYGETEDETLWDDDEYDDYDDSEEEEVDYVDYEDDVDFEDDEYIEEDEDEEDVF